MRLNWSALHSVISELKEERKQAKLTNSSVKQITETNFYTGIMVGLDKALFRLESMTTPQGH